MRLSGAGIFSVKKDELLFTEKNAFHIALQAWLMHI